MLKLIESALPKPNNLFVGSVESIEPLVTHVELQSSDSTLVFVDGFFQLSQVLARNTKSVLESWSTDCGWSQPLDCFIHGEFQLVCNIDGAKVFRSKLTSVWPVWIQVHNPSPVPRCSFLKMILFSLWHGPSKPDFEELLIKLTAELYRLVIKLVDLPELRRILFCLRGIV